MNTTLAKWMSAVLAITFMTTPILMYIDAAHREIVEITLNESAKRAAVEGYFSDQIINETINELVTEYNFDQNTIQLEGTITPTPRGQYIEATLSVPRGPIFIFSSLFNNGPGQHKKKIRIMSEAVN